MGFGPGHLGATPRPADRYLCKHGNLLNQSLSFFIYKMGGAVTPTRQYYWEV